MNPDKILCILILGMLLGATGQAMRAIVGLKKAHDEAVAKKQALKDIFDVRELVVSLIIGATAGGLASIAYFDARTLSRDTVILLMASGYAGADFIEGFMKNSSAPTPKSPPLPK